jgi:hypothetical protein
MKSGCSLIVGGLNCIYGKRFPRGLCCESYLTRLIKMPCLQKLPPKPGGSTESAFVADRRRANVPTLSRTKSLIDAALRLWELKQGTR